jgi:hypothetical protein
MTKTPYELRFEIFKQAYNMLQDNFATKFEVVEKSGNKLPVNFADSYPTLTDVINQANTINNFVSEAK